MNFKNKWLLVAIAIIVIAIIVMIARQSEDPITDPEATTTTEEVVIDDTLPADGDVIIDGEDVVVPDAIDPMEEEPIE